MPKKQVERIDDQSKRQGSNRSDFVRQAVRKQLATLERWEAISSNVHDEYKGKKLTDAEVAEIVRSERAK